MVFASYRFDSVRHGLTYFNTTDYQQPDYFMANRVVVGDGSYIDNQEGLNAVLANSATLTIEPGVHIRAAQEGALTIARDPS